MKKLESPTRILLERVIITVSILLMAFAVYAFFCKAEWYRFTGWTALLAYSAAMLAYAISQIALSRSKTLDNQSRFNSGRNICYSCVPLFVCAYAIITFSSASDGGVELTAACLIAFSIALVLLICGLYLLVVFVKRSREAPLADDAHEEQVSPRSSADSSAFAVLFLVWRLAVGAVMIAISIAYVLLKSFSWLFVGTFCLGVFLVVISIIDWKTVRSLHNAGFGMSLTVITTFVDLFMIAIFVL